MTCAIEPRPGSEVTADFNAVCENWGEFPKVGICIFSKGGEGVWHPDLATNCCWGTPHTEGQFRDPRLLEFLGNPTMLFSKVREDESKGLNTADSLSSTSGMFREEFTPKLSSLLHGRSRSVVYALLCCISLRVFQGRSNSRRNETYFKKLNSANFRDSWASRDKYALFPDFRSIWSSAFSIICITKPMSLAG